MTERRRTRSEDGFTLIEILIVVIIIGVLAAIVVLAVGHIKKDAVNASCVTEVKAIQLAEEAYNAHNHGYATDSAALVGASGNLTAWPGGDNVTYALSGPSGAYVGYTLTVSGNVVGGAMGATDDNNAGATCTVT